MSILGQLRVPVLTFQRFNAFTLRLIRWHVNCGHIRENGCYGCQSANNEIATRDSGLRRNHSTASSAPAARFISHPVALPRDSHYCYETEADHRCRHARPFGYPPSCKDHAFAARSGPRPACALNRHSYSNCGSPLARTLRPFVAADVRRLYLIRTRIASYYRELQVWIVAPD
jgi:hypothetical protein